ncbi:hypothetical protein ACWC10_09380 [Streptomyces sp. NPDC001595]|uniref:hypothetical protein n=1 Tax=Streptomyces sp. NPDC001532 TaxID=3154520 RepID=UPI00331C8ACD
MTTGTRLNQLPADQGGGGGAPAGGGKNLVSTPAEKKAAAKALQDHIEPDTGKAGRHADEDTASAVKAFRAKDGDGWDTSTALKKAHETWHDQVKNLMDRLGAEKDQLRQADTTLTGTDLAVRGGVTRLSVFDTYSRGRS